MRDKITSTRSASPTHTIKRRTVDSIMIGEITNVAPRDRREPSRPPLKQRSNTVRDVGRTSLGSNRNRSTTTRRNRIIRSS